MSGLQWLDSFVSVVKKGIDCRLVSGPVTDYDLDERPLNHPGHPCGNVAVLVRPVTRLISVRAGFLVSFQLPLAGLPGGCTIHFVHGTRSGLWLQCGGFNEDDPFDLASVIVADDGAGGVADALLAELEGEPFLRTPEWRRQLRSRLRLWPSAWRPYAAADGLHWAAEIDLTAET